MALTKVSTGVVDMSQDTGGLTIPKGTTAQQPTCTAGILGSIRENTTENKVEVCTANAGTPTWQFLEEAGTSFTPLTVDYLVVAGGGAGGHAYGASGSGGGAGEFLYKTSQALTTGSPGYSVIVGSGSLAVTGSGQLPNYPPSGGDSTFNLDVTNGGAGGTNSDGFNAGASGGSGSGGVLGQAGGTSVKTAGGLGNDGGSGYNGSNYGAGGGGGAITAGANGSSSVGGNGGNGETNSITGTPVVYSAGGGGGRYLTNNNAQGGSGGIGGNPTNGIPTTPNNYGCGGAGGSFLSGVSQRGGNASSGVVILRYPSNYTIDTSQIGSDLSSTTSNSVSGYLITTIICVNPTVTGTGTIQFT